MHRRMKGTWLMSRSAHRGRQQRSRLPAATNRHTCSLGMRGACFGRLWLRAADDCYTVKSLKLWLHDRSPVLENGHASSRENGLTDEHALTNGHAHPEEVLIKLEEAPQPRKRDHTVFGLGLYALSSCFLATMLVFAKRLGERALSAS